MRPNEMAAILHTDPWTVRLGAAPYPVPEPGEAVIRVAAVGFCGSDGHDFDTACKRPRIPGHEFCGTIEAVCGESPFTAHDRVAVDPVIRCGRCPPCRTGQENMCTSVKVYGCLGNQPPGGMAQYVKVVMDNCLPLPAGASFTHATFADPVAVALHALEMCGEPKGRACAVFGAGTIGLILGQLLMRGGARVIALDINAKHLEIAAGLGMEALDANGDNPLPPLSVDVAVELAGGQAPTLDWAIQSAKRTALIVCVAQRPKGAWIPYPAVSRKELRLRGLYAQRRQNFKDAVAMIGNNELVLDPLISGAFGLDDIEQAISCFRSADSVKTILLPNAGAYGGQEEVKASFAHTPSRAGQPRPAYPAMRGRG
ncbi:MAG: alcohol dehydrogenase catalytic domain-containing protein [Kiritimatiellae bacterium]|nr:alcohol dehydrogenase catalytic domain-containing protein [Kiritimatiellia bacterium]